MDFEKRARRAELILTHLRYYPDDTYAWCYNGPECYDIIAERCTCNDCESQQKRCPANAEITKRRLD